MKYVFTLALMTLGITTIGQDFQLFDVNTKRVFRKPSELSGTYSLVFDSVTTQGSDMVYYPYKSLGDSGYYSDTCYMWNDICYLMDKPTWLGSQIIRTGDVYNFTSLQGASVNLNFNLAPFQAHVFFEDNAQRFTISRLHSGIDTMNVLGIFDSVVKYQILHTDLQGNIINSALNNWQIIIGKQMGLISFFRIDTFPLALVPLTILGNESPNAGLFEFTNERAYNFMPGDVIQVFEYYSSWNYPNFSWEKYITYNYLERHETSDSLKYKVFRETYIPDSSSFSYDTIWQHFEKRVVIGRIPFDRLNYEILYHTDLTEKDYCGLPLYTYTYGNNWQHLMYCPEENSWCGFDSFGFTEELLIYVEGLGLYKSSYGYPNPMDPSWGSYVNYFSKQGVECGEKVVATNFIPTESTLMIYPNPTDKSFIVDGNSIMNADLQILNMKAEIVMEIRGYNTGSPVDIHNLRPGFYLVRVIDGNTCRNSMLVKQ